MTTYKDAHDLIKTEYCDYLGTIMTIYWRVYSLGKVMKTYWLWSTNKEGLYD
jgi:hypothetical protein